MERLARLSRRARTAAADAAAAAHARASRVAEDVAFASAAPEMPVVTVSVPKQEGGFGLILKRDASIALGSTCPLIPQHATIVQVGDQPVSSKDDVVAAVAGAEVGSYVEFSYRERPPPPEQRLVAKLPDGVLKDALPGMLSSARSFVEAEILPEAANLQEKYNQLQADRAKEAEAQATARALWEAAGRRKCIVVQPTVVRAGYEADSEELLPLRPGERLAILDDRSVPGSGADAATAKPESEPGPEPEQGSASAEARADSDSPPQRRRISFRLLNSDDLLGAAPPGGCWANTISEEGAVLIKEVKEGDRKHFLATLEERARDADLEGAAVAARAKAAGVMAATQEAAAAAGEKIAPLVEKGKEAAAPYVEKGIERVDELREKVQEASAPSTDGSVGAPGPSNAGTDEL